MAQEWDAQGNPIQSAPTAVMAQPTEWDADGKPISHAAPSAPHKGFLQSAYEASPLPIAASIIAHPINAAKNVAGALGIGAENQDDNPILKTIASVVDKTKNAASAYIQAAKNDEPTKAAAILANAAMGGIPRVMANQVGQGDYSGAAGTLAGTVGSALAPHVIGQVAPKIVPGLGRLALLGKTPEAAYESAMKPSTVMSPADRAAIVQTGLQNEIPVSKAGVEKIGDLIDGLNQKIKDTIASDPTRPIDPQAVATRADAARAKFATQVNAQPDLNAIEASRQQFLAEQGAKPGTLGTPPQPTGILNAQGQPIMNAGTPPTPPTPAPPMNAADAQAMKQGTYRVLKGKYGEQGSASVEAQKALARGLKEEIATQFPELSNLNAAESRLLDLQPTLERAVNRISNHQAIGIGTPVAGVAAEAMTGSPGIGRVAMVLKGVLDNPNVKSRLAIAVSKAQKIPIATATNRVNAYAASLGATALAAQSSSSSGNSDQESTQ